MEIDASIWNAIYIRGDQPTTCPKCGSRIDWLLDLQHVNNQPAIVQCLSPTCKFIFVEETDETPPFNKIF
ncbi:MAG: hypothetical protein JWO06_641 [Bacteroidota bacterium]|nr:hypothetical protein [Bacteroidota bacterium]